jgi:putative drug exporter of the RND superfamily
MFGVFGRFAQKYKIYIVAFWVILAAVLAFTAPSLSKVGVTDQSQFLPANTQSAYARDLLETKFPAYQSTSSSSGLIVVYNSTGLTVQDMNQAKALHEWINSSARPAAVNSFVSVFDNAALQSTLVSADNTTMMMSVGFSTTALDDAAKKAVSDIRAEFARLPGTTFYVTGNVGFLQDLFDSVQKTINKTTVVTIVLVIILLFIVFRSPIAALIPLIAIGSSFLISRGLIGFLAQAGVPISTVTDALMVVTIFGVGTDYCLFIISRFKEEMGQSDRNISKIEYTMQRIGPIILASAITVIIAFLCLTISRLGMTRTSGWSLAIGIAITLTAGLTLVPALMALFGRILFWPSQKAKAASPKPHRFGWAKTGEWIAKHPLWVAVSIIILLVLPYIAMPDFTLSANILTQLPKNAESTNGLNVIRGHFTVGNLAPLQMVIQSDDSILTDNASLRAIEDVSRALSGDKDLARVDYFSAPARPLNATSLQVRALGDTVTPGTFSAAKFSSLSTISTQLQTIALQYSGVTRSDNFNDAAADMASIQSQLQALGVASQADFPGLLKNLQQTVYNLADSLAALSSEFQLDTPGKFADWLTANYFSTDGSVALVKLIMASDPYADSSAKQIPGIRASAAAAVKYSALKDDTVHIGGDTALQADMLKTSQDDFKIVLAVASVGILLVIIILLRCLLAPAYMVATVLFNYGASLGITTWILKDIFGYANLINMLPVLVFVMLAAVGADYNIFLVSRIREESQTKPVKEAVQQAVAHTGSVITSCGIILAGTFATLMFSSFPMVLEIGTAIAIGVLVDTFLVRALLVPSLAALLGRWSWWPSKLSRKDNKN